VDVSYTTTRDLARKQRRLTHAGRLRAASGECWRHVDLARTHEVTAG
jgi:hypothetical protein